MIRFYLSLIRSVAYGESEVKLFACKEIINRWSFSFSKGEKWYDKLLNVKYLPLFHHFKAIYQFPKHIICLVKIVANASLRRAWRYQKGQLDAVNRRRTDTTMTNRKKYKRTRRIRRYQIVHQPSLKKPLITKFVWYPCRPHFCCMKLKFDI